MQLIDDSEVFGPVRLTVETLPSIALPLIDDSALFAPSMTGTTALVMPLIDDGD